MLRRSRLLLCRRDMLLANCDLRQILIAYSRWSYTLKHSMTRPNVPEPRCLMVMYVLFTIVVEPAWEHSSTDTAQRQGHSKRGRSAAWTGQQCQLRQLRLLLVHA